ncbi:MAG: hypothetical protein LIO94_11740, partial [Clostridiales bacterium]|nr:hypothetical protein [Clostridiales bacterium]
MKKALFILLLMAYNSLCFGQQAGFSWPSATVYFLITDRFVNGDTANDQNYGRINDYGDGRLNAATFHGGDLKGILQKVEEGYFDALGVDVVWMTDVYEQIHGWQPGSGGAVNDFPHYGYHGYYPLDYTQMDKNYGPIAEMRQLVDALHSRGIRVMLGANINDPGYPTLLDAVQYGFAPTDGMTAEQAAAHNPDWNYESWAQFQDWPKWWTDAWLRTPAESWDQTDKQTMTLYGLPDFKDEKTERVKLPIFLKEKWAQEGASNDAWVNPSARHLRKDMHWAPADFVIAWIASWVEEFGIDGFRCDIVEYVHGDRWRQLYDACNLALDKWRKAHPDDPASTWTDAFYLTGDFDNAYIDYKPDYANYGFSSMVNFYFPKRGDLDGIVPVWRMYADSIAAHPGWHSFNYLNNSYHRDADFANMTDCLTTLLLSPGVAQLFYGDETRRDVSHCPALQNVDSDQAFRADMDWDNIDVNLLNHCQKLGQIRRSHPVIATGRQITLNPHTCARISDNDTLIIRVKPIPNDPIPVSPLFPDGIVLTDLYTGGKSPVINGTVSFPSFQNNVAILA